MGEYLAGLSKSKIPERGSVPQTEGLAKGDEPWTRGVPLLPVGEPFASGLCVPRIRKLRERSRERECKGWLGLGNLQGCSEGRRGEECRNDGVRRGL